MYASVDFQVSGQAGVSALGLEVSMHFRLSGASMFRVLMRCKVQGVKRFYGLSFGPGVSRSLLPCGATVGSAMLSIPRAFLQELLGSILGPFFKSTSRV